MSVNDPEAERGDERGGDFVLSQHIAERLRESILRGDVRPGQRIRQEDVAARFKASRFPVREALRILESGGLVTVRANRGAWVNALSQAECVELYKVRERLEPLLVKDSVPLLGAEVIDELQRLLERLNDSENLPVDEYLELDKQFHALTYSSSQLATVRSLVDRLVEMTNFYRRAYRNLVRASAGRDWILQYDHQLIVDAILRRDAKEAAAVMRLHTRRARLALQAHPELFVVTYAADRED